MKHLCARIARRLAATLPLLVLGLSASLCSLRPATATVINPLDVVNTWISARAPNQQSEPVSRKTLFSDTVLNLGNGPTSGTGAGSQTGMLVSPFTINGSNNFTFSGTFEPRNQIGGIIGIVVGYTDNHNQWRLDWDRANVLGGRGDFLGGPDGFGGVMGVDNSTATPDDSLVHGIRVVREWSSLPDSSPGPGTNSFYYQQAAPNGATSYKKSTDAVPVKYDFAITKTGNNLTFFLSEQGVGTLLNYTVINAVFPAVSRLGLTLDQTYDVRFTNLAYSVVPVPEPSTLVLASLSAAGLAVVVVRSRHRKGSAGKKAAA